MLFQFSYLYLTYLDSQGHAHINCQHIIIAHNIFWHLQSNVTMNTDVPIRFTLTPMASACSHETNL